MKKQIFFFTLLLGICHAGYSQHVLHSNLNHFRPGDEIIKQQVEYKNPGRSGENVLWDFSKLDVINEAYQLTFSGYENIWAVGQEKNTNYYYTQYNDSLLLWGFENQSTTLQNHQPELLLKFPVSYGDKTQSYYYSHGKYANRLELDAMGSVKVEADAYGMMVLPSKDTLKHVLRIHTVKLMAQTTQPIGESYFEKLKSPLSISQDSIDYRLANDSVLFVEESYRWYEKGYRYPVFEAISSWEQVKGSENRNYTYTSLFYPPQEHYYLDEDEENLALLDSEDTIVDPWEGLTYNIYPNPVQSVLRIEMYLPRSTNIRINLRSTMGLVAIEENKGFHWEGLYDFQLDVTSQPVGNYILDIWLDEKLISEIIMKR